MTVRNPKPPPPRRPGLSQLAGLAVMSTVFFAAEMAVRVEDALANLARRHTPPRSR